MREFSIGVPQDLEPVLTAGDVARLGSIGRRKVLRRGTVIYRQGEAATHVFVLRAGTVQSLLVGAIGHESLLRIHLPGSVLGLTALASAPWRDATAKAVEDVELDMIERERLEAMLRCEPQLALRLIRLLVDRMRDFHFRVGDLQAQSVEQRLACALLSLSRHDGQGDPFQPPAVRLTHQELAQLVNTSRQTVSMMLSRFAEAGLVARRGRLTVLTNVSGLEAILPAASQGKGDGPTRGMSAG